MSWYKTGKISLVNGSASVVGVGTAWVANSQEGEGLATPDGRIYEIKTVVSDTILTLATPYSGASAAGQNYSITPTQGYVRDLAAKAAALLVAFQEGGGGGGGGGTSKVLNVDIPLSTNAPLQADYGYIVVPGVCARGLMSQLTITASAPGLFDIVIRGAASNSGTLWLQALSVSQKAYSISLPVYVENDAAEQDFFIGIRNRGIAPVTFTLTTLRMEKFA